MNILALDPGKTTGVAFRQNDEVSFDELDFDSTCQFIMKALEMTGGDLTIVSESFLITQHTAKNTQAPWSLELIGVARFFSRTYTGKELILQAPSAAKRFSSDDRLRMMGYWSKAKGHANDAARHLLLFEASRGHLSPETLQKFAVVS